MNPDFISMYMFLVSVIGELVFMYLKVVILFIGNPIYFS